MLKLFRSTGLMFLLTAFSLSVSLAEDEITISTYYPSPHGVYNQLQTNKLAVGDTDGLGTLDAADQPAQAGDIRLKVYDGDPQADNLEGRSGEILFSSENSGSLFLHNGTGWAAAGGGGGGTAVIYLACSWRYDYGEGSVTNGGATNWSCTPSDCPAGWNSAGISNEVQSVACSGGLTSCNWASPFDGSHPVVVGRSVRVCVK